MLRAIPEGYLIARSRTNYVLVGARALPPNGDMAAGLDAQRKVGMYPLSESGNPTPYQFVDRTEHKVDVTLLEWEDNILFWEKLHKVLQEEPAIEEFRPMYGMLANLGIEQGKPFKFDERMKKLLVTAWRPKPKPTPIAPTRTLIDVRSMPAPCRMSSAPIASSA